MKILILEKETTTVNFIESLIRKTCSSIESLVHLDSIERCLVWLNTHPEPNLIVLNTHLGDRLSLDMFKDTPTLPSLIFLSETKEFALDSFKLNTVDYLIKPFKEEDFIFALNKFLSINAKMTLEKKLQKSGVSRENKSFKNRFIIKYGDTIRFKNVEEIAYFFADEKVVYLVGNDGRRYMIDYNLESLEKQLNPLLFHRINRKIIVAISSIQEIKSLYNNRLQIYLKPNFDKDVYISKEKSAEFKLWLDI
jgi:two-component system response regulator LytT